MKKLLVSVCAVVLLIAMGTMSVLAAGAGQKSYCRRDKACAVEKAVEHRGNYVDADDDGICDNRIAGSNGVCNRYMDADNDGICDNHGVNCNGYVDSDNDGICDNRGTDHNGMRSKGTEKHCGNSGDNKIGNGSGMENGHGCHGGHNR